MMLSAASRATALSMRHVVGPTTAKAMTATVPSAIATGPLKLGHAAPPPIPNAVWRVPVRAMSTDSKKNNEPRTAVSVEPTRSEVTKPSIEVIRPEQLMIHPIIVKNGKPYIILGYSGQNEIYSEQLIKQGHPEYRIFISIEKGHAAFYSGGGGSLFTFGAPLETFVAAINKKHGKTYDHKNMSDIAQISRYESHLGVDNLAEIAHHDFVFFNPMYADIARICEILEVRSGDDIRKVTELDKVVMDHFAYLSSKLPPQKTAWEKLSDWVRSFF